MVKAEEVEALRPVFGAHDLGLVRVQMQPELGQGVFGQLASLVGALAGGAQDDEVVAVTHQSPPPLPVLLPRHVEHVQGDVGEQWGDYAPNTMGNFCFDVTLGYRRLERGR